MKIINVKQGTPEWLAWRKTVITATDCPAILRSSPWSTAYKAWQRKLDLIPEQESNEAMDRGKILEPEARAKFIKEYGINMTQVPVQSTEFDFLGASLDGLSDSYDTILEIKCGGSKLHDMAKNRQLPEYYEDQIQHQLLVTGAEKCYYYSYDGSDGICIEVFPDPEFKDKFLPKAREFWRCVAFEEPPALQDSDYKDMSDVPLWKDLASKYLDVNGRIKALEEMKEGYRKELIKLSGDQSCLGEGIRLMKTTMKGRVDYEAIPEIKCVDLEKYRKKPTISWKILVA